MFKLILVFQEESCFDEGEIATTGKPKGGYEQSDRPARLAARNAGLALKVVGQEFCEIDVLLRRLGQLGAGTRLN